MARRIVAVRESTSNIKTNNVVTFSYIMSKAGFKKGMEDFHAGRPIPEGIVWARCGQRMENQTWNYERGRLFAAATGIKKLEFNGSKPSREMVHLMTRLAQERVII